jgi:hypothetical protein
MLYEVRPDGISVHVVELLRHLGAGVDIEVVITALPEPAELAASHWKAKSKLTRALAFSGAEGAGDALLETLNDRGRAAAAGLAEKQVDMFGHKHVANKSKAVTRSRLFEGADGKIAGANGVQERPSLVAAEGDEMQIAKPGDAFKIFRHGGRRGAHPFQNRKGRPPRKGSLLFIAYNPQVPANVTC